MQSVGDYLAWAQLRRSPSKPWPPGTGYPAIVEETALAERLLGSAITLPRGSQAMSALRVLDAVAAAAAPVQAPAREAEQPAYRSQPAPGHTAFPLRDVRRDRSRDGIMRAVGFNLPALVL